MTEMRTLTYVVKMDTADGKKAAFFSIDDNEDKPMLTPSKNNVTVKESIAALKKVLM